MWFHRFNALLVKHPLGVKMVSGAVLTGTGDIIAQSLERAMEKDGAAKGSGQVDKHNPWRRFIVFTLFGATWTGPVNHNWLWFLAQKFPIDKTRPKMEIAAMLTKKLAVQHLVFNPLFYLPFFFTFNGIGMGKSQEEIWTWVKRDYWGMLVACWLFWIPISGWMFVFVPERFQSILMSAISLVWNSFLSWRSFRRIQQKQQQQQEEGAGEGGS